LNPRERTEQWETEWLSPLAVPAAASRGRRRPEPACALRTVFQRDRDRIIHSKSFRRLKHKTQVFISPEGDHYRTRLTHTLEVAQIARTCGRALRLNEDLIEAIALGHDLGHTPFGHSGETILGRIHPEGFRHNVQSLRVVDLLEGEEGLNLTWEVRDGIRNHSGDRPPGTLEGQVVHLADRIAYINHDIDDALRSRVLSPGDLPQDVLDVLGYTHRERINTMVGDLIATSEGRGTVGMSPDVGGAMAELRRFLFDNVYIGSSAKQEEQRAQALIAHLYRHYVAHPEQVPGDIRRKAGGDPHRAACDYVAGMTDRYATAAFTRMFLPSGWGTAWEGVGR